MKPDTAEGLVARLSDDEVRALVHDWRTWARPEQLPPEGDWLTWLLLGGRGSGKTRAGAEWVQELAWSDPPVTPIALVAETLNQAQSVMVEGVSGILNTGQQDRRPKFDAGRNALIWPNGTVARLMSASQPESFRGPQFAAAWCDDLHRRACHARGRAGATCGCGPARVRRQVGAQPCV
ncbi:MAG: DNA-packaging protein [Hyphomicrobiaceae bacterium]|nr:DNA-packaging protein [Hyphomicrobiaceae bacterium]